MTGSRSHVALFTGLALLGFAGNSLLCRGALRAGEIDPASFTSIRLAAGALTLAVLVRLRAAPAPPSPGSFASAFALFAYAVAFSFAYVRLESGAGALLLFGAVQLTMVGWGLAHGERLGAREWLGLVAALGGLLLLTLPTVSSPPPAAAASMMLAGASWGVYSLRGRGTSDPLAATAANFARAAPLALLLSLLAVGAAASRASIGLGSPHVSARGVAYALASGALASGVGYSLWYAALRELPATRAGIVQLAVPVVAAVGGVVLLGEHVTGRLALATLAILGGIALATLRPKISR